MNLSEARRRNGVTKVSEQDLLNAVIELANIRGWLVMHTRPAQSSRGEWLTPRGEWLTPIQGKPGFFDLVLARKGKALFIELKSDIGKLTRDQEEWAAAVGTAILWRPRDLMDGTVAKVLA